MLCRNLLIVVLLLCFITCKKSSSPEKRSFYMGVTPWPPDFTTADVDRAYSFINSQCDIVSHHFDDGIPYTQALAGLPMPIKLQQEVTARKSKTAAGKKILLSVSALALNRTEKAPRLADTPDPVMDNYWKGLAFNDSLVIKAYMNYMSYLVDAFQPAFVNFGVESNSDNWQPVQFIQYRDFLAKVFVQSKSKYPGIPFFISFMVGVEPKLLANAAQLTASTDYLALSAYPYVSVSSSANGNTDPALFPADIFTRFINLAPAKPFAFAETGYIAQDLSVSVYNLNKTGTAKWQSDYLEMICRLCNEYRAEFLIWFCAYDYDAGNARLKQLGLYQDLFAFWQDTGFYDENFQPRQSLTVWNNWMGRVRE